MPNIIKVSDIEIKELEPYKGNKEVHLLRYFEPEPGLFIAESRNVISIALDMGYEPVSAVILEGSEEEPVLSRLGDVPVYAVNETDVKNSFGYILPGGICCLMKRKKGTSFKDLLKDAKRIVILEDVENPTNVGAVIRSCAALGIDAVLLTKECADPLYRRALRVSVGTSLIVPWAYISLEEDMKTIKDYGFKIAGMALRENGISIKDEKLKKEDKLALILGNEGYGLKSKTISQSDYIVEIPMKRGVDSLNVAVACGIAVWEIAI